MLSAPVKAAAGDVPAIIADAGEGAVAAYRAFLDARAPSTRYNYRHDIARFGRWALGRGLTLGTITYADAAAYAAVIAAARSPRATAVALSPVRGLFHHLAAADVLGEDPFASVRIDARGQAEMGFPEPKIPLSELKATLLELDESWGEDEELFQAGLVMFSPLSLRTTDPIAISRFTGVPVRRVREFAGRLMANGRWSADGKIAVDSDNPDDLGISLMLNVLVAAGMLECRSSADGDGAKGEGEPAATEDGAPRPETEASDGH